MSQLLRNLQFAMCEFLFDFELGMGSVRTVCDMSNRHVSHGCPMDVVQLAYTPSQIEWKLYSFVILSVSGLPTVRQFLLKQTELKCVLFGGLNDTKKNAMDVIDAVKVLKCYSRIAT